MKKGTQKSKRSIDQNNEKASRRITRQSQRSLDAADPSNNKSSKNKGQKKGIKIAQKLLEERLENGKHGKHIAHISFNLSRSFIHNVHIFFCVVKPMKKATMKKLFAKYGIRECYVLIEPLERMEMQQQKHFQKKSDGSDDLIDSALPKSSQFMNEAEKCKRAKITKIFERNDFDPFAPTKNQPFKLINRNNSKKLL